MDTPSQMEDFRIVPLTPKLLAQTETWASSQNPAKSLLKLPVPSLAPTSDEYGWAALNDEDKVIAITTIRLNKEHIGYLECRVKPTEGRRGIGSSMVEHALKQPETEALIHLHAAVDMNNIPAQKTLDEHGFTQVGYTEDGRIEFTRHKLP